VSFSTELLLPPEHHAALAGALSVQQLDALPVNGVPAAPDARADPVLRLRLAFAPQKAISAATAQLAVACTSGARWLYPLHLSVRPLLRPLPPPAPAPRLTDARECADPRVRCCSQAIAPEVEGVLTLEAHLGATAELPLALYASGAVPQAFSAEFTPDSPLVFDVLPGRGLLPPAPGAGGGEGGGEQQALQPAAPLRVTFTCK
jgi:hypothetical protein